MKYQQGYILSVFSTLGNHFNIEPWILRIIGIILFGYMIVPYICIGAAFALFLKEEK